VKRKPRQLSAADQRAEHQLQYGLLAESVWYDLQPPTFLASYKRFEKAAHRG